MKKIIILCLMLALVFIPVTAFAEEATTETDTTITDAAVEDTEQDIEDENVPDATLPNEDPTTEEAVTIFSRIFEFADTNQQVLIMLVGFLTTIVITAHDSRVRKKDSIATKEKETSLMSGMNGVTVTQNGVIDAVNYLAKRYESMEEKYKKYEDAEEERYKLVGASIVQVATMLDILASVYVNSNHLPQGEKDLVLYKYTKCLAALEDDEKIKACVLAIRNVIGQDGVTVPVQDTKGENE